MNGVSPSLTISDVELGAGDLIRELIEGDLFISPPVTPFLDERIAAAAGALAETLEGHEATVVIDAPVIFTERTALVPDVAVWAGESSRDQLPALVVELRTESTDRYALGPKRVVYSRARVPEYWFVDPAPKRVYVMRDDPTLPDYPWPPDIYDSEDHIGPRLFPGARITVADLVG